MTHPLLADTPHSVIRARYYTKGTPDQRTYDRWVIHSAETSEGPETAEAIGQWFAKEKEPQYRGSTHYSVDVNSIVQHLDHEDVAWGAAGANRNGLHVEHAGTARQTREEWLDAYGREMLDISARLFVAEGYLRHAIPARWLTIEQMHKGWRGVCTHNDVTETYRRGTHWDPGPGFPKDYWLELVHGYIESLHKPAPDPLEDDEMPRYLRGVYDDGRKTAVYCCDGIWRREILPPSRQDIFDPGWRERIVEVPVRDLGRFVDPARID